MTITTTPTHSGARTDPEPVLQARGLHKTYGSTVALEDVDLDILPGESLAIMVPSGSGKTTLLHVLAGIVVPDGGAVRLRGRDVQHLSQDRRAELRRSQYGFVFQSGQLLAELTAVENVALPLMVAGVRRRPAVAQARGWFEPLGLGGCEDRRPGELSGGQQQRVAVGRALVARPAVLFADEPTGAWPTWRPPRPSPASSRTAGRSTATPAGWTACSGSPASPARPGSCRCGIPQVRTPRAARSPSTAGTPTSPTRRRLPQRLFASHRPRSPVTVGPGPGTTSPHGGAGILTPGPVELPTSRPLAVRAVSVGEQGITVELRMDDVDTRVPAAAAAATVRR